MRKLELLFASYASVKHLGLMAGWINSVKSNKSKSLMNLPAHLRSGVHTVSDSTAPPKPLDCEDKTFSGGIYLPEDSKFLVVESPWRDFPCMINFSNVFSHIFLTLAIF